MKVNINSRKNLLGNIADNLSKKENIEFIQKAVAATAVGFLVFIDIAFEGNCLALFGLPIFGTLFALTLKVAVEYFFSKYFENQGQNTDLINSAKFIWNLLAVSVGFMLAGNMLGQAVLPSLVFGGLGYLGFTFVESIQLFGLLLNKLNEWFFPNQANRLDHPTAFHV